MSCVSKAVALLTGLELDLDLITDRVFSDLSDLKAIFRATRAPWGPSKTMIVYNVYIDVDIVDS